MSGRLAMEDNKQALIKHLEMIQGVVSRLAHDSFLVKGWSMALLAAGVIFIAREDVHSSFVMLAFVVPVFGFWLLDAYFLWQERLFRKLYDKIRQQQDTDFSMNWKERGVRPEGWWEGVMRAFWSCTLILFYGIELSFLGIVALIFYQAGY